MYNNYLYPYITHVKHNLSRAMQETQVQLGVSVLANRSHD